MENYDREFLDYMKTKYRLTLEEATSGTEAQIIKFAIAWNVWKRAKEVYSKDNETSIYKFMSGDHSRLDYIFQEFRKSKNPMEARQLFLQFRAGMERHMKWEEDILFPLAGKKLGEGSAMIDELIMQHGRIREGIKEMSASLKERDAGLESDLERLLAAHDRMEENGIYPWIDDYVDGKERNDALSRMAR